jgi:hypothetical protein
VFLLGCSLVAASSPSTQPSGLFCVAVAMLLAMDMRVQGCMARRARMGSVPGVPRPYLAHMAMCSVCTGWWAS